MQYHPFLMHIQYFVDWKPRLKMEKAASKFEKMVENLSGSASKNITSPVS